MWIVWLPTAAAKGGKTQITYYNLIWETVFWGSSNLTPMRSHDFGRKVKAGRKANSPYLRVGGHWEDEVMGVVAELKHVLAGAPSCAAP